MVIPPSEQVNDILVSHGTSPISTGVRLIELMNAPNWL